MKISAKKVAAVKLIPRRAQDEIATKTPPPDAPKTKLPALKLPAFKLFTFKLLVLKVPILKLPHLAMPKIGHQSKKTANTAKKTPHKSKKSKKPELSAEKKQAKIKKIAAKKVNAKMNHFEVSKLVRIRQQLKFPTNLISDKELGMMIKMDTPLERIRRIVNKRFLVSVAIAICGTIVAFFLSKYFMYIAGGSWGLAGVLWYLNVKNTSDYYLMYSIARQIAFTTFTRIAGALLPELAGGANLLSVFAKVSKSMKNENDKIALQKLMIEMSNNKEDVTPFLEFAHAFSTTDKAELIMINMHQMYLGNTDTSGLQSLINDTNKDYQEQTRRIIEMKLHKFMMTTTKIAVSAIIVLLGYFGIYIVNLASQILAMMQHVKF